MVLFNGICTSCLILVDASPCVMFYYLLPVIVYFLTFFDCPISFTCLLLVFPTLCKSLSLPLLLSFCSHCLMLLLVFSALVVLVPASVPELLVCTYSGFSISLCLILDLAQTFYCQFCCL